MTGILEGIRVLDMGHVVGIPAAGAMLGDWGAEVIKIEPLTGEMSRGIRTRGMANATPNHAFPMHNRSKKGLALDMKQEAAKKIMRELVPTADIFMSNYEVGSLERLGLDYPTLSAINPGLIYCLLTGYGTVGPDKDQRGFDYSAAWARTGIQYMLGEPGSPPAPPRRGMMDRVSGVLLVAGMMAALRQRDRTGQGQEIEVSLYHTGVWVLATDIQYALMEAPLPKHDRTRAPNPLWNTYRTGDDRWVWLSMLQSDPIWPGFCRAIGRPELEKDPRFDNMDTREKNSPELIAMLDEIMASKTRQEWEVRFRENDCIYGCVQTPQEVVNDPQAHANNFFGEVPGSSGKTRLVNTPVNFRQNPAEIRGYAPEVGQHTEEILLELGYNWDDIAGLKEARVIL